MKRASLVITTIAVLCVYVPLPAISFVSYLAATSGQFIRVHWIGLKQSRIIVKGRYQNLSDM